VVRVHHRPLWTRIRMVLGLGRAIALSQILRPGVSTPTLDADSGVIGSSRAKHCLDPASLDSAPREPFRFTARREIDVLPPIAWVLSISVSRTTERDRSLGP
jgi:hypothetical protein